MHTTEKLSGTLEADETFIGGKNKNTHLNKKTEKSQGRSIKHKTPVFGMVIKGKVNTRVVSATREKTLKPIISEMVEKSSIVVTDQWKAQRVNDISTQNMVTIPLQQV